MASRARPRGICSGCGQERALRASGTIGKHHKLTKQGYTLGICTGVDQLPEEAMTEKQSETRARIQQTLKEYHAAVGGSGGKESPEQAAIRALIATSRSVETVLLAELYSRDAARADELVRWMRESFVDDGEVGDEWMTRWRDEAAAGQNLTLPGRGRVEWNHSGDEWVPARIADARGSNLRIVLDENQQSVVVERRHCRPVSGASEASVA
jgi:hypothetical protein